MREELSFVVVPISSIKLGSELKSGAWIVMYTRSVQLNIFLLNSIGDDELAVDIDWDDVAENTF